MAKEKKSKENIENTAQNGNAPVEEKKQASYRFAENDKNKAREKKKSLEEKYAVKKITPKRIAIIVLICLVAVGIITAGICIGMSGILSPASVKGSTTGGDVGGGGSGTGGGGQGGDVVHDIAYSVSYTSDVGEGKPPMSSNHYKNDKFRLEGCSFTYEGYEFLYWEYNGVYYKANAEFIMPDRNVTFKAVWKKAHDTGFEFELNADGTAYYLKGIGTCEGEEIMLPAKHGDLPVIKILKGAFKNCTFKAVKIADSIVEIGEGAFENCTNLEKIAIPALTQTVGENAFKGCTSLAEVTASDKLLYLGRNSFYNTKWYDNQANGQVYVNKVFYTYKGTCDKTLTLKNDTIAIASFALENQSTVEKVSIPANVEYIPGNFVSHCDSLASFAVDSGNQKYSVKNNAIILNEEKAIAVGCKATVIPTDGSIDKIWNEAFYGCAALKSIDIPDNVTVICEKAFYGAGLTTVDIHSDMQEIKSGAFDNLTSLTAINYNAVNCNASEKCINYKDFVGCGKNVVLNIGADVEVINGGVFSGSNSISKVNFDANCKVNTFGVNAFKGCMNTNLVRFDIPSTVTTLKAGCFADTTSSNEGLTWLIIPTTVTNIENGFVTSSSGAKQIFCYIDEEDKPEGWAEKWNLLHERTGETCKVYWNNQWWLNGGVPVALEA